MPRLPHLIRCALRDSRRFLWCWLPRWGKRRAAWSRQTRPELDLASELAGGCFLYHRVGYDRRLLTLRHGGRIGQGRADLERYWRVRVRAGVAELLVAGDHAVTMALRRDRDGTWRGRWRHHERMPVELVPLPRRALPDVDPAGFDGRRPLFVSAPTGRMTGFGHYAARVIRGLLARGFPVCLDGLETDPDEVDEDLRGLLYRPRPGDWRLLIAPLTGLKGHDLGPRTVVLTTWESEALRPEWVRALNRAVSVLVPCHWNHDCFVRSGVTTRTEIAGLGYDPGAFRPGEREPELCTFGFAAALTAGGVRKNVGGLVRAFSLAFPRQTDVRLRLKLTPRCPFPDRLGDPRIEVVKAYLTDAELAAWYTSLTAFVNPSRGEAWGLHLLEAMASGRPVISTPYSGVTEYFDESVGYPVAYRLVSSTADIYPGKWAEPDLGSLRDRLREVYHDRREARRRGAAAAVRARGFTWDATVEKIARVLRDVSAVAAPLGIR